MAWYALVCNPKCERRAEAGIEAKGFETYLPWGRIWSRPRRATGVVMRLRPAFARYLFVRCPMGWPGFREIDGVEGFIGTACGPLEIPEWQVLSTWAMERNGLLDFNSAPKTSRKGEYAAGDEVMITGGPFAGLTGIVSAGNDERRVSVELMLFGRHTVAMTPLDSVKRAA
jgi:transcription antitermination factor NusG